MYQRTKHDILLSLIYIISDPNP